MTPITILVAACLSWFIAFVAGCHGSPESFPSGRAEEGPELSQIDGALQPTIGVAFEKPLMAHSSTTVTFIAPAELSLESAVAHLFVAIKPLINPNAPDPLDISNYAPPVPYAIDQDNRATIPLGGAGDFTVFFAFVVDQKIHVTGLHKVTVESPSAPTLVPGPGWSSATEEPLSVGTGSGSDARAIARWDVVPYQSFNAVFGVGVVAFHMNGIDRVELSVENGLWTPVFSMKMNPHSGVHEYWANLDPAAFGSPRQVEVRAIAYPKIGKPRVLDALWLWAGDLPQISRYVSPTGNDTSGNGTASSPFKTVGKAAKAIAQASPIGAADGGSVLLLPGDHVWDTSEWQQAPVNMVWVNVQPAPSVSMDQVRIVSSATYGASLTRIRLTGVTVKTILRATQGQGDDIWLDGCDQAGNGPGTAVHPVGWFYGFDEVYLTDGIVRDDYHGPNIGRIVRGMTVERIQSDVFRSGHGLIANCVVRDVDQGSNADYHPDLFEWGGMYDLDNRIIYGVHATNISAQGIYVHASGAGFTVRNMAFVNVLIEKSEDVWVSQLIDYSFDHFLLWNVTLANMSFVWRAPSLHNISVVGTCFYQNATAPGPLTPNPASLDPAWFDGNHFATGSTIGSDASSGNPMFLNPAGDDFHPGPGSPLEDQLETPPVLSDALNQPRKVPATIGALE